MNIIALTMTCLTLGWIYKKPCVTRMIVGVVAFMMDVAVLKGLL